MPNPSIVIFNNACRDARLRGHDRWGTSAEQAFSKYYHKTWEKWEREMDGYHGVLQKARDWWQENSWRFS